MTDDDLVKIYISDFSRGQISQYDPLDLPLNASPECRNVRIAKHGGLIGRYGYLVRVTQAYAGDPDGAFQFRDSNNIVRSCLFAGGNLYETTSGTAVLVTSGAYTAGNRVCGVARNNVLIYSDGYTLYAPDNVGQRVWNPVAGTDAPVSYSAAAGRIPAPACKVMTLYTGQVLCGNCKLFDGTPEPETVRWSDVDFPERFIGTEAKVVGKGSGGAINSLQPFAISSDALSPTDNVFVGKSDYGIFTLEGATSAFAEHRININTGVLDGATAAFIPSPEGRQGVVVFLGVDRQVWWCSGTNGDVLSENIRGELRDWVNDRLAFDASQRFCAVRDFSTYQYVLDVGNGRQYCYQWDRGAWLPYEGWPSGLYYEGEDSLRQKTLFCAYNSGANCYVAELNVGIDDNGALINTYWNTPMMKGTASDDFSNVGDIDQRKLYRWMVLESESDGSTYRVTCTVNQGTGDSVSIDIPLPAEAIGNAARYDTDTYDSGAVYGDTLVLTYPRFRTKKRIRKIGKRGRRSSLAGSDLQVKVEQTVKGKRFALNGLMIKFLPRGMRGDHAA